MPFFLSVLFLLTSSSLLFAEESLTITTYYPSPSGSYHELQANKLAVGDTNSDGQLTSADQPPENGQIYTARSVIYKPQSSLPTSNLTQGELAYKSSDNSLYLYNGSNWVKQGGGSSSSVSYTYYCSINSGYGTPTCNDVGGERGYCPVGYRQLLNLGPWGSCYLRKVTSIYDQWSYFMPPGGTCGTKASGMLNVVTGQAVVCQRP